MKILLHDFANYAFTRQLAESLASRGHQVTYAFNASFPGPNLLNRDQTSNPQQLRLLPLGEGITIADTKPFVQRLRMELTYSQQLLKHFQDQSFDRIISANSPSLVQSKLSSIASRHKIPLVSWVQDLYGYASLKILRKKLPVVGYWIGKYFIHLDKTSLQRSHSTVVITDQFIPFVEQLGVKSNSLHVIENWAPVNRIELLPKINSWSSRNNLDGTFRFVYTGTLAMKHNPSLLVELAKAMHEPAPETTSQIASDMRTQANTNLENDFSNRTPIAEVVLVSSGPGARFVQEQIDLYKLKNLRCFGFQAEQDFASILASADVLVAILEKEAAQFSVPSKVLSYLCAGRPILASIPENNLAAQTIRKAGAGLTVSPDNPKAFIENAKIMMNDAARLSTWGKSGRSYAEKIFDIDAITDRFLGILQESN